MFILKPRVFGHPLNFKVMEGQSGYIYIYHALGPDSPTAPRSRPVSPHRVSVAKPTGPTWSRTSRVTDPTNPSLPERQVRRSLQVLIALTAVWQLRAPARGTRPVHACGRCWTQCAFGVGKGGVRVREGGASRDAGLGEKD